MIRKLLGERLPGYRPLLEHLSPEISPDEAEDAERASRKNIQLITAAIAYGVCVQLFIYRFPNAPAGFLTDLFSAGGVVVPLFLVSAFRIPFAGRLLLPLAAFAAVYRPLMPWGFLFNAITVFFVMALSFAAGRLLDFGASTAPDRKHRRLRRWTLLALGLVFLSLFWFHVGEVDGYFPGLSMFAALICCTWGWLPGRWLEQRANLAKPDAETLRLAAMMRWGSFAWGRALALLFGLLPFFLFLNGLDLVSKLRWPDGEKIDDRNVVMARRPGGNQQVWFWTHQGRLLRWTDLRTGEIYAFSTSLVKPRLESIHSLIEEDRNNRLRELLAEYRVTTKKRLETILANSRDTDKSRPADRLELFYLAKQGIVPRGPLKALPAIFSIEDLEDEIEENRLIAVSREETEGSITHYAFWQWLLLSFGLMGLTFLWRRGGDSAVARWLGIWLIGVGIAGTYRYVEVFLPALNLDLWHQSLANPASNVWLSILIVLNLITEAVLALFLLFVPCAALWVHKCWPVRRGELRRRWWVLSFAGRIALTAFCMSVCFYGILFGLPDRFGNMTSGIAAVVLFLAVACILGFGLRARGKRRSPPLDAVVSFLLLAVQVVTLTALLNQKSGSLKITGLILGFALLAGLLAMIFRKDLLYVSAARDLSFVVAYMFLPAVFAFSEEISKGWIKDLTKGAVVGETGAEFLWVVIAVVLLPPLRGWLEEAILYLSNPRLGRLRQSIEKAVEELVTLSDQESVQRIRAILQSCGVEDFVLYQRMGPDLYEAVGWEGPHNASPPVKISTPLRRFLSRHREFVDLDRVAFEWRFFFVQFELHRLRKTVGGRHLLALNLGTNLRAFLIVQERGAEERRVAGSLVIGEITNLGLAMASLRAVAQSVQSATSATTAVPEPAQAS